MWDLFDLAERLGMTVGTLRLGRIVPLSSLEFEMWRARDRALVTLDKQQANARQVMQTLRSGRRRR